MFIRTQRLFLRPRWIEDAPQLAAAIGHPAVVRMLAAVPWPYTVDDARAAIARVKDPREPIFLVTLPSEGGRIVGGCGLGRLPGSTGGPIEVGYWIEPGSWNRGYASEALRAVVGVARTLGYRRIAGYHAPDNPASGRVMAKAGLRPSGRTRTFFSIGRGEELDGIEYAAELVPMPFNRVPLSRPPGPARHLEQAA